MGTPTYQPIANITLSGSASSVTFSNITQAYRDLVLVVSRTSTSADNAYWRLNGDTGANYSRVAMAGNGSVAVSASNTNVTSLYLDNDSSSTTIPYTHVVNIMDYSATDKHKTVLSRDNLSSAIAGAVASRWAVNAAVTSISLTSVTYSFASGSSFALYGILA